MSDGLTDSRSHGASHENGIVTPNHSNCSQCDALAAPLAPRGDQVKLTEYEESAITLVAAKTKIDDEFVERFYRYRNDDYLYPQNRIIGLFVEVVADLKAQIGRSRRDADDNLATTPNR